MASWLDLCGIGAVQLHRLAKQTKCLALGSFWCRNHLGKQLSKKIFRLVRIFKELEQGLLVCHGSTY